MILALMFLVILGTMQVFGGAGSGIFNTAMTKIRIAMGG
jgi:Na+-translocating ferredoxin:NAD+ oxidoreductase RnfD subunit